MNSKGELLLVKRSDNNPHNPGAWEIPGGRLEQGENPFDGLRRETKDEAGLKIEVLKPLWVHHFSRDDRQKIAMITFLCSWLTGPVKLSEEHTDYKWLSLKKAKQIIHTAFYKEIEILKKSF